MLLLWQFDSFEIFALWGYVSRYRIYTVKLTRLLMFYRMKTHQNLQFIGALWRKNHYMLFWSSSNPGSPIRGPPGPSSYPIIAGRLDNSVNVS